MHMQLELHPLRHLYHLSQCLWAPVLRPTWETAFVPSWNYSNWLYVSHVQIQSSGWTVNVVGGSLGTIILHKMLIRQILSERGLSTSIKMSFDIKGTWQEDLFRGMKQWCFSHSSTDQNNKGRKRRLKSLKGAAFLCIRRWLNCPWRSSLWLETPVFTIQTFPADRAGVVLLI